MNSYLTYCFTCEKNKDVLCKCCDLYYCSRCNEDIIRMHYKSYCADCVVNLYYYYEQYWKNKNISNLNLFL